MPYTNIEIPPITEAAWVLAYRRLACAIADEELCSPGLAHRYPDRPLLDCETEVNAVFLRRNNRFGLDTHRFVFQVLGTGAEATEALSDLVRCHRERQSAQES